MRRPIFTRKKSNSMLWSDNKKLAARGLELYQRIVAMEKFVAPVLESPWCRFVIPAKFLRPLRLCVDMARHTREEVSSAMAAVERAKQQARQ